MLIRQRMHRICCRRSPDRPTGWAHPCDGSRATVRPAPASNHACWGRRFLPTPRCHPARNGTHQRQGKLFSVLLRCHHHAHRLSSEWNGTLTKANEFRPAAARRTPQLRAPETCGALERLTSGKFRCPHRIRSAYHYRRFAPPCQRIRIAAQGRRKTALNCGPQEKIKSPTETPRPRAVISLWLRCSKERCAPQGRQGVMKIAPCRLGWGVRAWGRLRLNSSIRGQRRGRHASQRSDEP